MSLYYKCLFLERPERRSFICTFASMNFQDLLNNIGIKSLNEMQEQALKAAEEQAHLMILANTGSGKTLAFLLPILQKIQAGNKGTQALIIAPTRELAVQIENVFKSLKSGIAITCCYGGHKREIEENNLLEQPTIIVGTPGRIADHLRRENIHPDTIETVVLDEFDKSLELGFLDEMQEVFSFLPKVKNKFLTSATHDVTIPGFLKFNNPVTLNYIVEEQKESLEIQLVKSADKEKNETLFELLCYIGNRLTIVFCNQREHVEIVNNFLKEKGIASIFYHGALEQHERDTALAKFRNGSVNFLITTDLAARGLDITNIRYVIHYQLPENEAAFIHRNGRTARMEASGNVVLLLGSHEYLPTYVDPQIQELVLKPPFVLPERPAWTTLFIAAGKKNKINKIDIVGFLGNIGKLKKEDIGLIEVRDFHSFAAVRKSKMNQVLTLIKGQKIKGQKVKMDIAK